MIKLIATDMDGTFLNEKNQFPSDFREVYSQLKERGIIFGAASGRQYYNLEGLFHEQKEDMFFIAENGTYVVYKGEELFSCTLDKKYVSRLIEIARTIDGVHIVVCSKKAAYVEDADEKVMHEVRKYYAKREVVKDLLEIEDEILKIALLDFKGAESNSLHHFKEMQNELKITVSGLVWLDIMPAEANKGIALQKVQEHFGVDAGETMVFGDYMNDMEMMQNAEYNYAMANAHEEIKKAARFHAKSNNESGVTLAIKDYLSTGQA